MYLRYFTLFLLSPLPSGAILTGDRWSDVSNSPAYQQVPSCGQPCILEADSSVNCWSYGCVCSENTLGNYFNTSLESVTTCATQSCKGNGDAGKAPDAFKQICGLASESVAFVSATSTSVIGSSTVLLTITSAATVTLSPSPTPSPTFREQDAIIIDTPADVYDKLRPCLRFIYNGCNSTSDNPANCHPDKGNSSDYTKIWRGLGIDRKCTSTECICQLPDFFLTHQHAFDAAYQICDVPFPVDDEPTDDFTALGQMLVEFCSVKGGNVLKTWNLSFTGYKKEKGLSIDTKIGIAVGVPSAVATIISTFFAFGVWRKKRREDKVETVPE